MQFWKVRLNGFLAGGATALIGIVMSLVIGIIGLQILNGTLAQALNGTENPTGISGLPATIATFMMPLFGIGLIILAVGWAFLR